MNEGLLKLDEFSLSGLKKLLSIEIPSTVTEIHYSAIYAEPQNFTIIGTKGSKAEEYANSEGIKFQAK